MLVSFYNLADARDVRVLSIAIDSEAMADSIQSQVARDSTEAEDWEVTIIVIRFNDLSNVMQRLLILVRETFTIEMERAHLTWVAIRSSVIDGGY